MRYVLWVALCAANKILQFGYFSSRYFNFVAEYNATSIYVTADETAMIGDRRCQFKPKQTPRIGQFTADDSVICIQQTKEVSSVQLWVGRSFLQETEAEVSLLIKELNKMKIYHDLRSLCFLIARQVFTASSPLHQLLQISVTLKFI